MAVLRTAAIKNVQAMLGLPELDGTRPVHKDCLLVSCDVEDFSRNRGQPLLELGVAILDTRAVLELDPSIDDDFAYLSKIQARHFRFQESCHIPNTAPWLSADYNQPDKFMFGKTEFIWREQLQEVFTEMLCLPDDKNEGKLRHVHFVTQGGDHDRAHIGGCAKPAFSFDALLPGNTTEELQFTSRDAMQAIRTACNGQRPALWKVLDNTGLECLHLHNAGNDAVAQLSALAKLALMECRQRYAKQDQFNPDEDDEDWPEDELAVNEDYVEAYTGQAEEEAYYEQHAYDGEEQEGAVQVATEQTQLDDNNTDEEIEETAKPGLMSQVSNHLRSCAPAPLVGTNQHCTRCGSDEHDRKRCKSRHFIECQRCFMRGHHVTQHCGIRTDEYLEKKRRENWERNWYRDLKNKIEPNKYVKLEDSELSSWDNIFETDTPRCNRRAEAEANARARAADEARSSTMNTVTRDLANVSPSTTPAPLAPPRLTWAQLASRAPQTPVAQVTTIAAANTMSARSQTTGEGRALQTERRPPLASAPQQNGRINRGGHTQEGRGVRIGSNAAGSRGGWRGGRR